MKQRNKTVEIIESAERIESQINFIVNTSGVGIGTDKAKNLRERIEKLVDMVHKDMSDIHDLK